MPRRHHRRIRRPPGPADERGHHHRGPAGSRRAGLVRPAGPADRTGPGRQRQRRRGGAARLLPPARRPRARTAGAVRDRAGLDGSGRSTLAVLGESYDGPFGIDIRRDGPHGLVAGTTGAGKSELLQTIVASLAVANRPDAMNFVLIDYKGGSAFKDCARLPHTVGMVSDLDGAPRRAGAGLAGGRAQAAREILLAAAGAKDIEDYTRRRWADPGRRRANFGAPDTMAGSPRARSGGAGGVPRGSSRSPGCMLVIDEFASMVRSCRISSPAWSASPSGAGRSASTSCWPPSGPPGRCARTSGPTPTCGSRCG